MTRGNPLGILTPLVLCAAIAACDGDSDFDTTDAGDTDTGQDICGEWNAERADLSEGDWSGDTASCEAGDVSDTGRDNALKVVNLYRSLAGLPEVATDPDHDAATQECALMMHAGGSLSHSPDTDWPCYSDSGAQAAGSSNIASAPGVSAVDLYMIDPGNENTLGHRRWILSGGLGPIGLGSTDQYSCMWVFGGSGATDLDWIAWPPDGEVPFQIVQPEGSWSSLDATGWSIQSDFIDLSTATVTVQAGGEDMPVTTSSLADGYGSFHALKFIPDGWTTEAGTTYTVTVDGASEPISYSVTFTDCE